MKQIFKSSQKGTQVLLMLAFGMVYYLAVPAEHQIFKFLALVVIVVVFGWMCYEDGRNSGDGMIDRNSGNGQEG
jgi:hypothetical protein